METNSIKQIKEYRDQIVSNLKDFDNSQYLALKYGSENEYTGKSLYLGLNSILNEISYLIRASNIFITISTLAERNEIVNDLNYITTYINSPENLCGYIDNIKVKLRKFNIKNNRERWELFLEVNKNLLEQSDNFSKELKNIEEIKAKATETNLRIEEKLEEINNKFKELTDNINEVETTNTSIQENSEKLKEINTELLDIKTEATGLLKEVNTSFNEVKSNEKIITTFAKNIQDRDNKLIKLEQATDENNLKLEVYNNERINILKEAEKLIESAKEALKYKTAEGISASFQTHHDEARKWQFSIIWILGSLFFMSTAIGLGIWVLKGDTDKLHIILGRIALIPLPVIATVFCAKQYVKQKNIIEDYAYKMVLSKSMVGFSEQLKKDPSEDKGEYIHYMKVALEEIHKDPLRNRNERTTNNKMDNNSVKELVDMAEQIIRMSKNTN
jgi:hypothetical protein